MPAKPTADPEFEIGHVLFIDTVGYSKLLINEQSELLNQLKEIVRATKQFGLAEAEGKLLRLPTGDGTVLVFRNSSEAPVQCALEIAKALKGHPDIQLRMGVHSGPVSEVADVNERANVAGAGINIAQRVMDCGDAGHILVSRRVAEDLEHYARWRPYLHDLGEYEVKHGRKLHLFSLYGNGFGNPTNPAKINAADQEGIGAKKPRALRMLLVAAVLLALLSAVWMFWQANKKTTWNAIVNSRVDKSIAVLPFENLSSDKENAYFAEGIQDEILTRLSKIGALKVISRTSTQRYKSVPDNLREVARQLGVTNILEGSVQKAADQVRVNVQLINAESDAHVWANTYDHKLTDIFRVESEVATAIAEALQAKLTGGEQEALAVKPTDNPQAYDAYLRGLAFEARAVATSPDDYQNAARFYEEAVRRDPAFAVAWAHLSIMYSFMYHVGFDYTPDRLAGIQRTAETAQQLQPNLGEGYLAMANYQYRGRRDYNAALGRPFSAPERFSRTTQLSYTESVLLNGVRVNGRRRSHTFNKRNCSIRMTWSSSRTTRKRIFAFVTLKAPAGSLIAD